MITHFGKNHSRSKPLSLALALVTSLPLVAFLLSTTAAQASSHRPNTNNLSCAAATSLVQNRGSVSMSTGPYTYKKYVKNRTYCNANESAQWAYVPTKDKRRCKVGYICEEKSSSGSSGY